MKSLNYYPLAMFAFLTFMLGCNEFIDEYESTWEYEYEEKVEKSLEASKKQNVIFLDFEFGMSQVSYDYHRKNLLKEGVLRPVMMEETSKFTDIKIDSSKLEFNLKLPSGTHSVLFYPKFEDDKLVQLELQILPKTVGRDLKKLYQEVLQVYKVRYGNDLLEKKQVLGPNEFFWFKSNKQIKLLQSVLSINVLYSDLDWLDIAGETTDNSMIVEPEADSTTTYQYL
jgi:hypothetical protein